MPNLKEKQIIRLLKRLTGIILPVLFLTLTLSVKSAFADYDSAEIVHHLGETVPLDLTYTNSDGNKVLLKDLINKPTVLDFCYYHCAGICTPLMMEVSDVIG